MSATYDQYNNVVRDDFGYKIYLRLADNNDNPLDLSDVVELEFHVWKTENAAELQCSGICSVVDSTLGLCFYLVPSGAMDKTGEYMCEVSASYVDKVVTATGMNLTIWTNLPGV